MSKKAKDILQTADFKIKKINQSSISHAHDNPENLAHQVDTHGQSYSVMT